MNENNFCKCCEEQLINCICPEYNEHILVRYPRFPPVFGDSPQPEEPAHDECTNCGKIFSISTE